MAKGTAKLFNLGLLTDPDEHVQTYDLIVRLIAWRENWTGDAISPTDPLIQKGNENALVRSCLILYLGAYDPAFFQLSKEMTANDLLKSKSAAKWVQRIAGTLLRMSEPKQARTKSTRDVLFVFAIALKYQQGYKPMGRAVDCPGGIEQLIAHLRHCGAAAPNFEALELVWRARQEKLAALNFAAPEITEFFERTSPMQ